MPSLISLRRMVSAAMLVLVGIGAAGACKRDNGGDIASPDDEPKPKKTKKTDPAPKTAAVPEKHRAEHVACDAKDTAAATTETFAPRMPIPPGPACKSKADCKDRAGGRCSRGHCTYDNCREDKDCAAPTTVCTCEEEGSRGYYCKAGNCAVDADCGAQGYCSPSWSSECGAFLGVVGWYCHGADDECTNDSECVKGGEKGYCAWDQTKKHWRCGYGHCVG